MFLIDHLRANEWTTFNNDVVVKWAVQNNTIDYMEIVQILFNATSN